MAVRHTETWQSSLNTLCQQFIDTETGDSREILNQGFKSLYAQGYPLDSVERFRGIHMQALLQEWSRLGIPEQRLQAQLQVFRDFCGWIKKPGLVEGIIQRMGIPIALPPPRMILPQSSVRQTPQSRTRPDSRSELSPSKTGKRDIHRELAQLLRSRNGAKTSGTIASFATQKKRSTTLHQGFRQLRVLGFKLPNITSFREKHLLALARYWESTGAAASTIQNNISIFRVFAEWIGKTGMIRASENYVSPGAASRSSINREDKSWTAKAVSINSKIAEVVAKDARVGLQLKLQAVFGLRAREAVQLRPHLADKGNVLAVTMGTKGGRERVVPIDTQEKRSLIDLAKTFADKETSTADPTLKLDQALNRYYYVLRGCGISRKDGITGHGLRHGYANDRYQQVAGAESPVRGGETTDRRHDRLARLVIAEELGHSRASVTTHYLG